MRDTLVCRMRFLERIHVQTGGHRHLSYRKLELRSRVFSSDFHAEGGSRAGMALERSWPADDHDNGDQLHWRCALFPSPCMCGGISVVRWRAAESAPCRDRHQPAPPACRPPRQSLNAAVFPFRARSESKRSFSQGGWGARAARRGGPAGTWPLGPLEGQGWGQPSPVTRLH